MLDSLAEFKFVQSFRIPIENVDDLRFLLERPNGSADKYIDDAKLIDISKTGVGFSSFERLSVGSAHNISIQYKRFHLDIHGKIIRAFSDPENNEKIIYGFQFDQDEDISTFLETYINNFNQDRLKSCIVNLALKGPNSTTMEGFEMFSLILSLFKDITKYGNRQEFLENMLSEVTRLMNAQRASIFLINTETSELEAVCALGADKKLLKFDYRLGIAGSVFTTGVALNIDVVNDHTRFTDSFDQKTGFQTKSIICNPISNREDKIIGVIEVLNKRDEDRFTVDDEKIMKVLSLIFSSVYHSYNPISETSQIRRFSGPFDREYALVGTSKYVDEIRSSIIKLKDIDSPVLIQGEMGVGKSLLSKILHFEGARGLQCYEVINCGGKDLTSLRIEIFGDEKNISKLEKCKGGTLLLKNIQFLPLNDQEKLFNILHERRIPGSKISLDVRTIVATHAPIEKLVDEGKFHRGLFDYISTANVKIAPLRRRIEDMDELISFMLKVECKKQGLLLKSFSASVVKSMKDYHWPGNIEELRKCIERAVLYNPKTHIITSINSLTLPVFDVSKSELPLAQEVPQLHDPRLKLKDRVLLLERQLILTEVKRNFGNKSHAAKNMGISREALRKKMLQSQEVLDRLGEKERKYHLEIDSNGANENIVPIKRAA